MNATIAFTLLVIVIAVQLWALWFCWSAINAANCAIKAKDISIKLLEGEELDDADRLFLAMNMTEEQRREIKSKAPAK